MREYIKRACLFENLGYRLVSLLIQATITCIVNTTMTTTTV